MTGRSYLISANQLTVVTPGGYSFAEFRDVNAMGWILGNAGHSVEPYSRAFVLVPDPCSGDFDLDSVVNSADLGVLLGAWGGCSGTGYCQGDLDFSGAVDSADMGILLGQWGDCGYAEATQLACLASACASPPSESKLIAGNESLDAGVQYVGFASVAQLIEWLDSANELDAIVVGELLESVIESIGGNS